MFSDNSHTSTTHTLYSIILCLLAAHTHTWVHDFVSSPDLQDVSEECAVPRNVAVRSEFAAAAVVHGHEEGREEGGDVLELELCGEWMKM